MFCCEIEENDEERGGQGEEGGLNPWGIDV